MSKVTVTVTVEIEQSDGDSTAIVRRSEANVSNPIYFVTYADQMAANLTEEVKRAVAKLHGDARNYV